MNHYLCEEQPTCPNFQSAICLHCNQRLCLTHITEHNQIIFRDVEHLYTELNAAVTYVQEQATKSELSYKNVLTTLNTWRAKQTQQIDAIYHNQLQLIVREQETTQRLVEQLVRKLDVDVEQQLSVIKAQQTASIAALQCMRQTIENVQRESDNLPSVVLILPSIQIEESPNRTSTAAATPSPTTVSTQPRPNLKACRPNQRLIELFSHLTATQTAEPEIRAFIRSQGRYFRLDVLVCSYLMAWYKTPDLNTKVRLLNTYVSIIDEHLDRRIDELDVLFGLQAFFHGVKTRQPKATIFQCHRGEAPAAQEMMTFLLQFLTLNCCLTEDNIHDWYHTEHQPSYPGYPLARELAGPYIGSSTTQSSARHRRNRSRPVRPRSKTSQRRRNGCR